MNKALTEDDILRQFDSLPRLFTTQQMQKAEEALDEFQPTRRAAFVLGTKSGKQLDKMVRRKGADTETLAALLYATRATKAKAEGMLAIAQTCEARYLVALCARADMEEIFKAADRMAEEQPA